MPGSSDSRLFLGTAKFWKKDTNAPIARDYNLPLPRLFTSDPIHGAAFEVHHCEDADLRRHDLVEDSIRKSRDKAAADLSRDHGSGLRMLQESLEVPVDFFKERYAETGTFEVVVLSGFV